MPACAQSPPTGGSAYLRLAAARFTEWCFEIFHSDDAWGGAALLGVLGRELASRRASQLLDL